MGALPRAILSLASKHSKPDSLHLSLRDGHWYCPCSLHGDAEAQQGRAIGPGHTANGRAEAGTQAPGSDAHSFGNHTVLLPRTPYFPKCSRFSHFSVPWPCSGHCLKESVPTADHTHLSRSGALFPPPGCLLSLPWCDLGVPASHPVTNALKPRRGVLKTQPGGPSDLLDDGAAEEDRLTHCPPSTPRAGSTPCWEWI